MLFEIFIFPVFAGFLISCRIPTNGRFWLDGFFWFKNWLIRNQIFFCRNSFDQLAPQCRKWACVAWVGCQIVPLVWIRLGLIKLFFSIFIANVSVVIRSNGIIFFFAWWFPCPWTCRWRCRPSWNRRHPVLDSCKRPIRTSYPRPSRKWAECF